MEKTMKAEVRKIRRDLSLYDDSELVGINAGNLKVILEYLVELDEKASEPEYEYALEETSVKDGAKRVLSSVLGWSPWLENVRESKRHLEKQQQIYIDYSGHAWYTYRIVQRPKPEPHTYLEEEVN